MRELGPLDLQTFRKESDPEAWFEKEIQADFTIAPEIMKITLKGSDPTETVLILNAVRDAYVREVVNRDRNERANRLAQVKDVAARQEAALAVRRQQLTSRAEALGARDVTALRVKYERVLAQVMALKAERLYYRSGLERAELDAPPSPEEPAPAAVEEIVDRLATTDPVSVGHRAEITRLEGVQAELRRRLKGYDSDPDYVRLGADLTKARAALATRRQELEATATAQLRTAAETRRAQLLIERGRMLAGVKKYLPELDDEIKRREQEDAELAKGLADLELLRGEIGIEEERVKLAHSRMNALEVELEAPSRASLLEAATIIETPRWDRPLKIIVAPALAAFVFVLLGIAWLDTRSGRVDGAADVEAGKIRVVGAVPATRSRVLATFQPPEHAGARQEYLQLTNAVEMTRAVLGPVIRSTAGYVLVVTSATTGEGKTVVSGHLAARLARAGYRTLLVDTDARRSRANELFGLPGGPGFTDLLLDRVDLADVVRRSPVPGLDVITAGNGDPHESAEVLEQRLAAVLGPLRAAYDVVLLDTPPLMVAPEALILSRAAQGVLLTVMRDVSRLPDVIAGYDRLRSIGAHVLGAVVSGGRPLKYHGY
jgi:capsular exopolysaccharide synthesis family protein